MRKSFPGYYKPTKEEFDELWNECIFILDANVLLNLYRYTKDTREELISLLKIIKKRLWLPYQAGYEFHKNRLTVISSLADAYGKLIKQINETSNKLDTDLNAFSRHPLIDSKAIKKNLSDNLKRIEVDLEKVKEKHPNFNDNDDVLELVTDLFNGQVGSQYSPDQLKKLYDIAQARFKDEIPPGYKDTKSKDGDNKYGDFILWQQVIDKAKDSKKPIILITDDTKEDWWRQFQGQTIGPRPELIEEIYKEAGVRFYMYQTDPFMENASTHFKRQLNDKAVQEVKMVRDEHIQRIQERLLKRRQAQKEGYELLRNTLASENPYLEAIRQGLDPKLLPDSIYWRSLRRDNTDLNIFKRILEESKDQKRPKGLLDLDESHIEDDDSEEKDQ